MSVLTDGYWPDYHSAPVHLPQDLSTAQEIFKEFYLRSHSGRKLAWIPSLCQCVVKADFEKVKSIYPKPQGKKELSMSLFQSAIILLFNNNLSLTTIQIQKQTNIDYAELKRALQSMACAKIRILSKEPKGKEVSDTDLFTVNTSFSNPHFRIKVNAIQIKETVQEQHDTAEKVFQDRIYVIDAAIVRIMKTRKSLSHELLIAELCEQLKFKTMVIFDYFVKLDL